jgi:phosphomannomutase
VRLEPAARDAVVARLRAQPPAGWAVEHPAPDVLVLRRGGDGSASPGEQGAQSVREPTSRRRIDRVVVRPSGTEPKLKAYLQVVEPVEADVATARAAGDARMATLRAEVTELLDASS